MAKYKNKDGIELSFEGHENDSHIQLIKEVVIEAIKIGDRSGYWSSNWKRFRNFLSENFDVDIPKYNTTGMVKNFDSEELSPLEMPWDEFEKL